MENCAYLRKNPGYAPEHFTFQRSSQVLSGVSNISVHELINEIPTPLLTAFENLADTDVRRTFAPKSSHVQIFLKL